MIELPDEVVIPFFDQTPGRPHVQLKEPRVARALFVGALLVRATFDDENTLELGTQRQHYSGNRWAVDMRTIPGLRICDLFDFKLALLVADEVSRFAIGDLEQVKGCDDLVVVVGRNLGNWIQYVCNYDAAAARGPVLECDPPHPWHFRLWCEQGRFEPPAARACAVGEIGESESYDVRASS